MFPRPTPRLLILAITLLFPLTALPGAMLVDWGGQYVTGNAALSNGSTASMNYGGFTDGDPQLISPSAGYSGPQFHGQINWPSENTGIGALTGNGGQMVNNNTTDRLELKRGGSSLAALILFRQGTFLNGLNSGNVSFDSSSTVSMNINTFALYDAGRVVIRLEGGSLDGYYVSQEAPFNGLNLKSANLTSLTWLAYDPATNLRTFGSAVNILEGGLINHVTEVGFYAQQAAGAANSDSTAFRLDSFEVTAVPEPGAGVAIFLGLALLNLCRGGRRRD
jgi:hypothetical protein